MFFLLKHRQVLLEIFSKNYRVRRNLIQSRLTQECGEDLSKQEVDKVLKVRGCLRRPELGVGGRPAWGGGRWRCGRPALLPSCPLLVAGGTCRGHTAPDAGSAFGQDLCSLAGRRPHPSQ